LKTISRNLKEKKVIRSHKRLVRFDHDENLL